MVEAAQMQRDNDETRLHDLPFRDQKTQMIKPNMNFYGLAYCALT